MKPERTSCPPCADTVPASVSAGEHKVLDVTVVLLEGGYASTAIGPIEVFHSAGVLWNWLHGGTSEPRFRVRTASLDGKAVTSLCSLGLTPEFAIGDIEHTDIVILPASGWNVMDQIAGGTALLPWLRHWYERGAYIAGICSGVGFLAECGILDGKEATTHWALAEGMRERYPRVHWKAEHFVTEDRRVLCSGGVYAAIDLSLYLVEKFCGHEVALQCARSLLVSMPRTSQTGYSVVPLSRPHEDGKIRQAEDRIRKDFVRGVAIDALASEIGMSPRTFIRRFKSATGRLPNEYLQMLRITSARELLEQGTLPIQTVCLKIGYEDVAFFRGLFKRHTGMTPGEYRERFAPMGSGRGGPHAGAAPAALLSALAG